MLLYIWLFNQYTWILLDLPEKYKYNIIFALFYLSMFVICLFFYADWIPYKITQIIDFFPPQIELFKSSGVFFLFIYFLHIAEI